jgi:hypothetical protein
MKYWTLTVLAAAVAASGAFAQDRDAYNLDAATADLAAFHKLARDGVLKREDARSDVNFAPRFDQADLDRDGVVTAAEMDKYIAQAYGVTSSSAAGAASAELAYRRHAATRDLEAFHQLARGGAMRREDALAYPGFGDRFYDADYNGDGVVTAQEMERYVLQSYGLVASIPAGRSPSASVGSSAAKSGSASAGSGRRAGSAPASTGNSGK